MNNKNDLYHNFIGGLLAVLLFFAALGVLHSLKSSVIDNKVVIIFGVIIAFFTFIFGTYDKVKENRRHSSKDYLDEALSMLERAYYMICDINNSNYLTNDRARWISCADLLLSAEGISQKILLKSHIEIFKSNKKYWQIKFYDILHPSGKSLNKEHFRENTKTIKSWGPRERAPVSLKSILIVYDFSMTRSLEDAWDKVKVNDQKYSHVISPANPGVSDYFDEFYGRNSPIRPDL